MAAALRETVGLYETLKAEWNKKNPNLNKCGDILSKLKVAWCIWFSSPTEKGRVALAKRPIWRLAC